MQTRPHPPGFSLIELLVVISIIILMLGIGVAAMTSFYREAETSSTQVMLRQLQGVYTEYKAQTGGSTPDPDDDIANVVQDIKTNGGEATERMLRSIDKQFWEDGSYDGGTTAEIIFDAWNNEIEYVQADGSNGDISGDMPPRPQPYFASAGPDGNWGTYGSTVTSNVGEIDDPDTDAKDNIFSFETGR